MAQAILVAFIILALACSEATPTQVPTDTPIPTPTTIPTSTPSPTQTPTPTLPPASTPLTLEGEGVVVYPYSTPPPNSIVSRRIVVGTKTEDGCSYHYSGMGSGGTVVERELAYNPETCESLMETIFIPDNVQVPTHTPSPTQTPGPTPTVDPGLQAYLDWMAEIIDGQIAEAEQGGMPELAECLKQLQQAYVQGTTVQETVEERCDSILAANGWGEIDRWP